MQQEKFTDMRSLLNALAISLNLINPYMEHHHEQTAYLAFQIAYEMGLRGSDLNLTVYSALLHDIGSVVTPEVQDVCEIESNAKAVASVGAEMLRDLDFGRVADVIEINQNSYVENLGILKDCPDGDKRLAISQAIHLADAVTSQFEYNVPILNQVKRICSAVEAYRGTEFMPEALDAFLRCSEREFMWMDVALNPRFLMFFTGEIRSVSLDECAVLTRLMSRIIDYRSSFTAMHSAGVAASARALAQKAGMSETDVKMMTIAGYLHDVGKLRVPNSILEKPGKLTEEEFNIVKEHPYYTRLILKDVPGFEKIADWAAFHHEKLNGRGYPFHFRSEQLDLGSRIMAVADIFSAITEVRPYRAGMNREAALRVLWENVENGSICSKVVGLLADNYDEIDSLREQESREAGQRYFRSLELKK
ncbi:MAG: HD domain-containing protein [Oscillospiraceae bacterium]|nr:HD domain-containing protein [Oscillospiraceae bacterium]